MKHTSNFILRKCGASLLLLSAAAGCASAEPQQVVAPVRLAQADKPAQKPVVIEEGKVAKIGEGALQSPISIRTSPKGELVVLDQRATGYVVVLFSADGQNLGETPVPADMKNRSVAFADSSDNLYVAGNNDNIIWKMPPDGKATTFDAGMKITGAALQKTKEGEFIYATGTREEGIARFRLPKMTAETITLSQYPERGALVAPHVRPNGSLYAFSTDENLVYHYNAAGKFIDKIGGQGPRPPQVGVPAGVMGSAYDVDTNGDVYWSLGDYGALLKLSADGKTGVAYHGQAAEYEAWTGPLYTVTGLALSGDRAYEIDLDKKRLTAFPKSFVTPGAPQTDTIDARIFGYSYNIKADAPYKLFTDDTAALRISFDQGNRRVHKVAVDYQVYDLNHESVAKGMVDLDVPGNAAGEFALPPIKMPRFGWYQIDTALRTGDTVLMEQAHFFARTQPDAQLPIPAKEVSGWDDIETHKMIGLGLHRFGGDMKALLVDQKPAIAKAEQMGVPYFLAITHAKDCTPENVTAILKQYPKLRMLEIVNEPNLTMSVENYVKLLEPCFRAAKKVNREVQIMGPTQCGTELNWFESFFKNGGGNFVDIVSVHTYERHNSMDMYHWNWKFNKLREIMGKYRADDKPLYQTEHGALGDYHGPILRHRWQARMVLLEMMELPRHGIDLDQYYYYYVNQGGFADFSAYMVNNDRELFPVAVMTRARKHMLGNREFDHALNMGTVGNWLALGNVYQGTDTDVVEFINAGAAKPVDVNLKLPAAAKAYDSFGNPMALKVEDGAAVFPVGMYPSYIVVPRGAPVAASIPGFGKNIAPQARISVTDEAGNADKQAQEGIPRLVNGILEFDFESQPLRVGMRASDGNVPLDVTLELGGARRINSAILYSTYADNDKAAPLEYEVQVRSKGTWKKVDSVAVATDSRSLKIGGNVKRLTWYESPWIFEHRFAPVSADAVRFHFTRTTNGQYPTPEINSEVSRAFPNGDGKPMPEHVELREIQVFEAP